MDNLWGLRSGCPLPKEAHSCSGELVVCASGSSIWSDLDQVPGFSQNNWTQPFDIMAVNDAGMHIPYKLKHWYSNDSWLQYWHKARRPRFSKEGRFFESRKDEDIKLHCYSKIPGAVEWGWPGGGTSTLNACMTGLGLGYSKIYLCGAPLDDNPHYFDPPWERCNFSRSGGLREWQSRYREVLKDKVVSMSGNTKRILEGEILV